MAEKHALDRLCAHYGIAPDYVDIWGNHHRVPQATQRALLAASGIAADTAADVQRALDAFDATSCVRLLPPVQVVRETGAPLAVTVTLPVDPAQREFAWALVCESGERLEGCFDPAQLAVIEERTIAAGRFARRAFVLPAAPGIGYHRFELWLQGGDPEQRQSMSLIVAPSACHQPEAIGDGARVWGPSVQLYALRSQRNWGIGDFGDLQTLVDFCADQGAGVIGVSPLHALFPDNPEHAGPYSPSSRRFLNVLHLDVEAMADYAECESVRETVRTPEFQARLRALRAAELVQYGAVADAKFGILEALYAHFREHHQRVGSERGRAFQAFRELHGEALRRQALFEALQAHFRREDASVWGWPAWPEAYRDPDSPAVLAFHDANAGRVDFHAWLQWQAQLQLTAAGGRSAAAGLGVGLLFDLAVGTSSGGGETWGNRDLYATGAGIGAPPDDFNLHGQDWGLAPFVPHRLAERGYEPFIAILRAWMREAGALRIDHVMGLQRLFWIPRGAPPADGAYVHYPFDDLLAILALESTRNRCLVIGEDLGTVTDSVREALRAHAVLSYRVLYFTKESDGSFTAPARYPHQAIVAVTTHDLPTLAGFWQGWDLDVRTTLELFPTPQQREAQIVNRAQDRARLLVALEQEQLVAPETIPRLVATPELSPECVEAVHRYLARTPASVMLLQIEDVFGQCEQVNLPATTDSQHPNWRRKLPLDLEEWPKDPRALGLAAAMREERGRAVASRPLPDVDTARCPLLRSPPRATYRLQFNAAFTFVRAAELVPYLDRLGVSHCYASPFLKARPGSAHGYDIVDHGRLNPEVGSDAEFAHFVAILHEHGMGQIIDVVPNHMGVMCNDNPWWLDVLENGRASVYARFFDIDWFPYRDELRGKLLLPVLGDHYGLMLDRGELRLAFDAAAGEFSVIYQHHRFPVDPREYTRILGHGLDGLAARLGPEHPQMLEFDSLVTAFGHLPGRMETDGQKVAERNRDKEILKQRLARCHAGSADIAAFIGERLARFDAGAHQAANAERLHGLLEVQAYRLAYWRVASDEINYRRFVDINELAALRIEHPDVFEATHALVFDLLAAGRVDGLRVDHPDGLYDPVGYLRRIHERAASLVTVGGVPGRDEEGGGPLFVVVEKILAADEHLPEDWPVSGTTGYDFMNLLNGLFVEPGAKSRLERTYAGFVGARVEFTELLYGSKHLIMKAAMAGELNVLAHQLSRIAQADRRTRDFTMNGLCAALAEVVACLAVYRTYVSAEHVSSADVLHVEHAVTSAKRRTRAEDPGVFDFIRDVLLKACVEGRSEAYRDAVTDFAMKFQQYTSPVMAKGLEDTSFYLHNRLVSLNEVGGDPRRFGVSIAEFHRANEERSRLWPNAMLASSTHDSKRSEDVRARLNVLSELPEEWHRAVTRWHRINRARRHSVSGAWVPTPNDEYLFYQTLVGIWPFEEPDEAGRAALVDRIEQYMLKAVREGKANSSWTNPEVEYESALSNFVRLVLIADGDDRFAASFRPFQQHIARLGMFNSLSQVVIKLTAPGVPDIYQGNELWDFSLVDPDNRRAVDFERRQALLAELEHACGSTAERSAGLVRDLLATMTDGRIKLYVTWKALWARRARERLFRDGAYLPLQVAGRGAAHLCAYARRDDVEAVVVIVPRLFAPLVAGARDLPLGPEIWRDTRVEVPFSSPGTQWVNAFSADVAEVGECDGTPVIDAADALHSFPYALLLRAS